MFLLDEKCVVMKSDRKSVTSSGDNFKMKRHGVFRQVRNEHITYLCTRGCKSDEVITDFLMSGSRVSTLYEGSLYTVQVLKRKLCTYSNLYVPIYE